MKPSNPEPLSLTVVQRHVIASVAREYAEVVRIRQAADDDVIEAELTLAQRCRDVLRYEATVQALEAERDHLKKRLDDRNNSGF